jgi:hypothetical protein
MKIINRLVVITLAMASLIVSQTKTAQPRAAVAEIENSLQGSLTYNGRTVNLQYADAKSGSVDNNKGIHLSFT